MPNSTFNPAPPSRAIPINEPSWVTKLRLLDALEEAKEILLSDSDLKPETLEAVKAPMQEFGRIRLMKAVGSFPLGPLGPRVAFFSGARERQAQPEGMRPNCNP